jgi:hypothetical protein
MRVEMAFNDTIVTNSGYQKSDIYQTIAAAFQKHNLRCVSSDETLSFEDNGQESDYAYMWKIILGLLKSDWFVKCASSCTFYDDDDSKEDVLSQAWKVQKRMA